VGPDGEQIGIRPLPEALTMAREKGLDLVEVANKANPPVCRMMDYGKFKYENAQRAKESRKKSSNTVVKEMKYRPKIGTGDFDQKTAKVEKFLLQGHKVKLTIMFRGREVQHPEFGRRILDQVAEAVVHAGRVEASSKLEGRNMTMVLGPDRKAQAAWRKKQEQAAAAEASAAQSSAEVAAGASPPDQSAPADSGSAPSTAEAATPEPETTEPETTEPAVAETPDTADQATAAEEPTED
jgi:translation initiation factor IF-3